MTVSKRKISTKKFLPSLTEIPEESRSYVTSSETRKSSVSSRETNNTLDFHCVAECSSNLFLSNDDKEKRKIIQKWLQTIPMSDTNESSLTTCDKSSSESSDVVQLDKHDSDYKNAKEESEKSVACLKSWELQPSLLSERVTCFSQRTPNIAAAREISPLSKSPSVEISFNSLDRKRVCEQDTEPVNMYDKTEQRSLCSGTVSNVPGCSSSLPLDEELTMQNAIYNIVTGNNTLSKLKMKYDNENRFSQDENAEQNLYSLVSEVYVNDNFSSNESSLTSSCNSLVEETVENEHTCNNKQSEESSRLMIQLNDCPFFYSVENSDEFEPDTLDRKLSKEENDQESDRRINFVDSLERPAICLRSHGSFRKDFISGPRPYNNLKRSFSSLQEIYQQRRRTELEKEELQNTGPQSLTPQIECMMWKEKCPPRHYFRQKKQSSPPPIPNDECEAKPALPLKKLAMEKLDSGLSENQPNHNASNSQINHFFTKKSFKLCFKNNIWSYRPEDSGYLSSSDSEKSLARSQSRIIESRVNVVCLNDSHFRIDGNNDDNDDDDDDEDDDESASCSNDANSESGAESTATNFKFYKSNAKLISDLNKLKNDTDKVRSVLSSC